MTSASLPGPRGCPQHFVCLWNKEDKCFRAFFSPALNFSQPFYSRSPGSSFFTPLFVLKRAFVLALGVDAIDKLLLRPVGLTCDFLENRIVGDRPVPLLDILLLDSSESTITSDPLPLSYTASPLFLNPNLGVRYFGPSRLERLDLSLTDIFPPPLQAKSNESWARVVDRITDGFVELIGFNEN